MPADCEGVWRSCPSSAPVRCGNACEADPSEIQDTDRQACRRYFAPRLCLPFYRRPDVVLAEPWHGGPVPSLAPWLAAERDISPSVSLELTRLGPEPNAY